MESNFSRESNIEFANPEFNNELNINVEDKKDKNKLFITLTVNLQGKLKGEMQFSFLTKYVGIFEVKEDPDLPTETFGRVNGPAIIFPFVREHIANLSLKAGINPILLPPINFVKLNSINEVK